MYLHTKPKDLTFGLSYSDNMNSISIPPALSNYSLKQTLTSGQTFRWLTKPTENKTTKPLSNPNTDTFYLPVHTTKPIVYKVTQSGNEIKWENISNTSISKTKLQNHLKKRLGFSYPYKEALSTLQTNDPELYANTEASLSIIQDYPFETTISFICSPQATIDRIYQMQRNIESKYGTQIETTDGMFYTFPTIRSLADATETELKNCNLGYRASYVNKTSNQLKDDNPALPKQQTNIKTKTLSSELQNFTGVGPKVADCILLYSYNRTDVIPIDTRIQQMVTERYDKTATTTEKAKQTLESVWGEEFGGYYQLLLYDFAAENM